jgi:hypothetical protein
MDVWLPTTIWRRSLYFGGKHPIDFVSEKVAMFSVASSWKMDVRLLTVQKESTQAKE